MLTRCYVAPEVMAAAVYGGGMPPAAFSMDVFSSGLVLAEIFSSCADPRCFQNDAEAIAAHRHPDGVCAWLEEAGRLDCGGHDTAKELVVSMLAQNPRKRPTMTAIASHPYIKHSATRGAKASNVYTKEQAEKHHAETMAVLDS